MYGKFLAMLIGYLSFSLTGNVKAESTNIDSLCSATITYKEFRSNETVVVNFPTIIYDNEKIEQIINETIIVEYLTSIFIEDTAQLKDSTATNFYYTIEYEIKNNSDCILSIFISKTELDTTVSATNGFYSTTNNYLNFDLNTGSQIQINDIIRADKMGMLVELCNKKLQHNYSVAKKKNKEIYTINRYEGYKFATEDLSTFYFTNNALCFNWDFNFRHCDLYAAPNSLIEITKEELKQFLIYK
ncbi:MAG: hypothetical protein J0M08_04140 [Bacteroidetes bacterium]|nr:hypothetical protein [Bacteroidota bacterium]